MKQVLLSLQVMKMQRDIKGVHIVKFCHTCHTCWILDKIAFKLILINSTESYIYTLATLVRKLLLILFVLFIHVNTETGDIKIIKWLILIDCHTKANIEMGGIP